MSTLQTVVLIAHTVIALAIIALVLLQRGKGADAGAAFGAGASGTVFGARGSASFFSRTTAVLATAFFISSLALAYMSSQRATAPESLLENAPAIEQEEVEALPEVDEALPAVDPGPAVSSGDEAELPALDAPAELSDPDDGE